MSIALKFSRIEPNQRAELLQAIHAILTEVDAHNADIYNEAYWDWQYRQLPSGKSYVYGAWDGDKLVGYYHVPVYRFMVGDTERLVGNIQDVAVNPNYRGQGLFRRLAEFANEDLDRSDVELIYTFPNHKSIRTFLKYNDFKKVSAVPAYVRPLRSGKILASKVKFLGAERMVGGVIDAGLNLFSRAPRKDTGAVERITKITDEVEAVFIAYGNQFRNRLVRDKQWLDWRYLRSQRGKHHIMGLRRSGKLTAIAVFKEDEMLGNPALLIMDLACIPHDRNDLLYLIDQVRKRPELVEADYDLLFASGIAPTISMLTRIGFVKVPERFNPRVLNLLVRSSSELESSPLLEERNWLLTLGDWDVF